VRLPALDIAARNTRVHDLADSAGLPLCRDVGVAQCLRIELLGTHPVTRVVLQKGIDHARLRVLLHEVLLMGLQRFLHGVAERQPVVAAVVNRHGFCPELIDIGARFLLVVQNVGLSQFRIHRDGDKAAVARAVTGQKILPIGRASKDALAQTVGRMGLVGDFIGFLLFTEKTFDLLDTLGIGGGDHLRHFDDPVALQLSVHIVVVQPPQVVREPFILDRQQPKKAGLSCALSAHQTEHGLKLTSRLEHAFDGSQQENFHSFASVLVLRSTEEMMQDMGNPFSPIPFQTVQIIPDGVVAILVGNDADGGFDLLLAENAVLLHSP